MARQAASLPGLLTPAESVTQARSLRVWTASARESIAQALSDVFAAWLLAWGVSSISGNRLPVNLVDEWQCSDDTTGSGRWRLIVGTSIWWSFHEDSNRVTDVLSPTMSALRQGLLGQLDGARTTLLAEPAPIEREIVDAAWHDWWSRLTEALGAEGPVTVDEEPGNTSDSPPDLLPWSGSLVARIDWGNGLLLIRLEAAHAARLSVVAVSECGSKAMAGMKAVARTPIEDAIAKAGCRLRVDLGQVELSLGQLQELAVGDVIPLACRLDVPAVLRAASGDAICGAWLGQREGHVAIELSRLPRQGEGSLDTVAR